MYTVYQGATFTVEWYYTKSGEMSGYEYYKTLDEHEKVRFFHIIKYYADSSLDTIIPKTLVNIEDKEHKIYALKPYSRRFFCFIVIGRKIIITNGYRKKSQVMAKKDKEKVKISIKHKDDYLSRLKGGDYYEKYKNTQ